MSDLDVVIDWASSRARDRISGQGNLFDLLSVGGEQDSSSSGPSAPP